LYYVQKKPPKKVDINKVHEKSEYVTLTVNQNAIAASAKEKKLL